MLITKAERKKLEKAFERVSEIVKTVQRVQGTTARPEIAAELKHGLGFADKWLENLGYILAEDESHESCGGF